MESNFNNGLLLQTKVKNKKKFSDILPHGIGLPPSGMDSAPPL